MKLEKTYDRFYKKLTIVSSIICIVFFGFAAIEENFLREWKNYQLEFKDILIKKAENEKQKEIAENFLVEIKQVILDDFKRVDRCVSCHNGIENPKMADQLQPHKNHSGNYLKNHPVDKFGCSICHGGQDRALAINKAFAATKDIHWDYPVLPIRFVQSSCGKCHLSVFDKDERLAGAEVLTKGREFFHSEGCPGCHNVRGTGGSVGLEMTNQGSKTKHEYSFRFVEGEHTVPNWLREHFINPQKVSTVSGMPPIKLDVDEMDALITFTMSLYYPEFPSEYYSINTLKEFKGDRISYKGQEAYDLFCAVCHGENGEGKDYRVFEASVPALNNQDFLAVASEDMLKFTISKGRSGRTMSSWAPAFGGLSEEEIDSLVKLIHSWKAKAPDFSEVKSTGGDIDLGMKLFRSRCGTCHGPNGEGGIGTSLNNQDFLTIATDEFLYKTMVTGRENTAMPSWSHLTKNEIANLIVLVRSWQKAPSIKLSSEKMSGDIENGGNLFAGMCAGCHGKYGQGTVGPAILNRDFLQTASDQFILNSFARGRGQTAMRSWAKEFQGMEQLTRQEMNDIVAFMRSKENTKLNAIYTNISPGTPTLGKELYQGMCSGCHGVNGEGKHGPALNNQEFLNAATNGFIQATITLGRAGTAMRSWAKGAQGYEELSADEINDITSYIRTWQREVISIQ